MSIGIERRRYMGARGETPLPYDAQISYLQSNGKQWIDTGVTIGYLSQLRIELGILSYYANNSLHLFGFNHRTSNYSPVDIQYTLHRGTDVSGKYAFYIVDSGTAYGVATESVNGYSDIIIDGNIIYINGTGYTNSYGGDIQDNTYTFGLLNWIRYGNQTQTTYSSNVQCFYFKAYHNNELVADMIPVRVGSVGYMYDRVSGEFFGNAGSGSFILGPDV